MMPIALYMLPIRYCRKISMHIPVVYEHCTNEALRNASWRSKACIKLMHKIKVVEIQASAIIQWIQAIVLKPSHLATV